jgi:hypothetical protein
MDEDVANFVAITSADPQKAAQYLRLADNNLELLRQPELGLGRRRTRESTSGDCTEAHRDRF